MGTELKFNELLELCHKSDEDILSIFVDKKGSLHVGIVGDLKVLTAALQMLIEEDLVEQKDNKCAIPHAILASIINIITGKKQEIVYE